MLTEGVKPAGSLVSLSGRRHLKRKPDALKTAAIDHGMEALARAIVKRDLNRSATALRDLSFGYVGRVYRVSVAGMPDLVVKMVKAEVDRSFEHESVDDRVYGGRWANFAAAYRVLEAHDMPLPRLYALGQLEDHDYAVMEFLDGESSIEGLPEPQLNEFYGALGGWIGRLHAITRTFQGWADMDRPYSTSWESAFFASFENCVRVAADIFGSIARRAAEISDFSESMRASWTDPRAFVLSHADGFQGLVRNENGRWRLIGIIDIEDYQFTDPRFVLAGMELGLELKGRSLPRPFWQKYARVAELEASFGRTRNLFKVYYLLNWLAVLHRDRRDTEAERTARLENLERRLFQYVTEAANANAG